MGFQFNPITGKLDLVGTGGGAAQVNSDWNATSGVSQILNKPSLSAVATSGSASDLSTGTLALARLDPLVAIDDLNNNFTAGQTITAPANTSALTASYSVTGANTTALVDLSGTWNTTGIANGIRLNITDTASAASSFLLDLQTAGTSRFRVGKQGDFTFDTFNLSTIASGQGFRFSRLGNGQVQFNTGFTVLPTTGFYALGNGSNPDTYLYRDAANTLAQRNGTNAQTFRLYGTHTDASNGRRLDITSTTGGIFTLTATGNGTGASGNVLKLTAPVLIPASSVTLATNGDLAFEATSNTSLTVRYRGTDGTTRSASLTLA